MLVEFALASFARNKTFEVSLTGNVNYKESKVDINIDLSNNYDINIGFKVYINDVIAQEITNADLLPSNSIYSFTSTIDTTIDNTVKLELTSNENGQYEAVNTREQSTVIPKYEKEKLEYPYDKRYDRITEDEVVDDILSDLNIGRDIYVGDNRLLGGDEKLVDSLCKLNMSNPLPNDKNFYLVRFNVESGTRLLATTIMGDVSKYEIYRAYADKSRLDLSDIFTQKINGNKFYAETVFDTPYPSDDTISLIISTN